MKYKTISQLIDAMRDRAVELASASVRDLRLWHPDNIIGVSSFMASKSSCVEAILMDEFEVESNWRLVDSDKLLQHSRELRSVIPSWPETAYTDSGFPPSYLCKELNFAESCSIHRVAKALEDVAE